MISGFRYIMSASPRSCSPDLTSKLIFVFFGHPLSCLTICDIPDCPFAYFAHLHITNNIVLLWSHFFFVRVTLTVREGMWKDFLRAYKDKENVEAHNCKMVCGSLPSLSITCCSTEEQFWEWIDCGYFPVNFVKIGNTELSCKLLF